MRSMHMLYQVHVYPRHPANEPFFPNLISEKNRRFVVLPTVSLGGGREEKRDVLITGLTLIFVPPFMGSQVSRQKKSRRTSASRLLFLFSSPFGSDFLFSNAEFSSGKVSSLGQRNWLLVTVTFFGGEFLPPFMRQRLLKWKGNGMVLFPCRFFMYE